MLFPFVIYTLSILISFNVIFAVWPYWKASGFPIVAPLPALAFVIVYLPVALLVVFTGRRLPEEYAGTVAIAALSIAAVGLLYRLYNYRRRKIIKLK
jgi:hypothetical protein